MTSGGDGWRPRVIVCGTGFGRTYLAALRRRGMPFELAGILARGSQRSRACAGYYGVPLYTSPEELPPDIEVACVVVNAAPNGGRGAELAQDLMARGIHVLQEHPLHQAELAACLRQAHRNGVVYHLNSHYVNVDTVACFIRAARRLIEHQRPVFVDALTSFQVLYPLMDILGQVLGGVRPWSLTARPPAGGVLRSVDGIIGGVPVTLRIQNQIDPRNRDNGPHIMHRVTLATEGGNLLLANTHGPVLWSPRLHMPADYSDAVTVADSAAGHLDLPGVSCLTSPEVPSHREVIGQEWPLAAGRALLALRDAVLAGQDPLPLGQHQLAICRLVADVSDQIGRPEVVPSGEPLIAEATTLACGERDAARSAVSQ
jgi:thiazolinyl imide reductase